MPPKTKPLAKVGLEDSLSAVAIPNESVNSLHNMKSGRQTQHHGTASWHNINVLTGIAGSASST